MFQNRKRMFKNRKRMFKNRKRCSKLEKGCSKTENLVIFFKKVCKSAIAHRTSKTSHTHALRTHSSKYLSARTSARTSHVRKCDFTHMCAATQHLYLSLWFFPLFVPCFIKIIQIIFSLGQCECWWHYFLCQNHVRSKYEISELPFFMHNILPTGGVR